MRFATDATNSVPFSSVFAARETKKERAAFFHASIAAGGAPRIHGELLTADTVVADVSSRDGMLVPGRAEIVEDAARKRAIVTAHPFVPIAPLRIVGTLALDVFALLGFELVNHSTGEVFLRPVS